MTCIEVRAFEFAFVFCNHAVAQNEEYVYNIAQGLSVRLPIAIYKRLYDPNSNPRSCTFRLVSAAADDGLDNIDRVPS